MGLSQVDWRLIPVLSLLYLVSYLDRANIGNANIEGLSEDLRLSSSQYNLCLAVFFIPYVTLGKQSFYHGYNTRSLADLEPRRNPRKHDIPQV